jgi:hypothetical protein
MNGLVLSLVASDSSWSISLHRKILFTKSFKLRARTSTSSLSVGVLGELLCAQALTIEMIILILMQNKTPERVSICDKAPIWQVVSHGIKCTADHIVLWPYFRLAPRG